MRTRNTKIAAAVVGALLVPSLALGQEAIQGEIAPADVGVAALGADDERIDGWSFKLNLAATGAWNHSSDVVGAVDGATSTIGAVIDAGANLIAGQHEWQNSLKLQHAQTKTPTIPEFVKSSDQLDIVSTYLYRLASVPWIGPYARGKLTTSIMTGHDNRDQVTTWVRPDGTTATGERIELHEPFEPLVLRESVGLFANPVERKTLTIKSSAGLGAQHIIADALLIADNGDTPEVELADLQGGTQAGAEAEVEGIAALTETVSAKAKANVFVPLTDSSDADLTGFDGMNTDLSAGLSVKLSKWASLDYTITAKKVPHILDEWQVTNGLMLTSGFNVL